MTHNLKINPEYFEAVLSGLKKFEIRKNDRNYKVGDFIILAECSNGEFSGRTFHAEITYIIDNFEGCKEGYVTFGFVESINLECHYINEELLEANGFELVKGFIGVYNRRPTQNSFVSYQMQSRCLTIRVLSKEQFADIAIHCDNWNNACAIAELAGIDLKKNKRYEKSTDTVWPPARH